MKKILFYSVFVVFFAASCEKSDLNSTNEQMVIKDDRLSVESFTISETENEVSMKGENLKNIIRYLNKTYKDNMDEVVEIQIERVYGKEERRNLLLYLRDSDNDRNRPFAIVLEKVKADEQSGNGKQVIFRMAESHSCSGDPCSCCAFVRDDDGSITGCECNGSIWKSDNCPKEIGQKCNHTVST